MRYLASGRVAMHSGFCRITTQSEEKMVALGDFQAGVLDLDSQGADRSLLPNAEQCIPAETIGVRGSQVGLSRALSSTVRILGQAHQGVRDRIHEHADLRQSQRLFLPVRAVEGDQLPRRELGRAVIIESLSGLHFAT